MTGMSDERRASMLRATVVKHEVELGVLLRSGLEQQARTLAWLLRSTRGELNEVERRLAAELA